ncbi:MAG TPA: dihydrolipoyl dehydrogenase [Alphaproteobacteria bacterium]|nr:dihydrolipoyl dehydrogenase [Alphaproteobacteria bacterium]
MAENFDLVVIGGGPGGYICAIRAAQLGMRVACVEKRGALGGTCLNVGCIPSKALLHVSELFAHSADLAAYGVKTGKISLDLPAMMAHKDKTVSELAKGIEFLFKKNKVAYVAGAAKLTGQGQVEVRLNDGGAQVLTAPHIVIATGSAPASLPGIEIDEDKIVSSTGALALKRVPKHLVVVGGGVIGLELGSVWGRLGAKITVVEFLDHIIPGADRDVGKNFQRILKKQGMEFKLSTKVTGIEKSANGLKVSVEPAAGGASEVLEADAALIAIGRKPYTDELGLDTAGIATDRGQIVTDPHYRTNVEGVYAIGDVIAGPMLAHKAEDEGVALAELLAGKAGHVNYAVIPSVIYTSPEVAWVGKTEEQLKADGVAYKAGKFPFAANARARVAGGTEGFVKVLADAATDRVLGVHMIGPDAGNMIGEAALAMEFGASSEDIARTCHAHPTLSESLKEAALAVDNRTLNM